MLINNNFVRFLENRVCQACVLTRRAMDGYGAGQLGMDAPTH